MEKDMLITLGIRAEPKQISFVVYSKNENTLLCVDKIVIPKVLTVPEKLKYLRNSILDILREYSIDRAALRVAEGSADNKSIPRYYIEAVIQEAFSSSTIKSYSIMRMSTIIKKLGIGKDEYNNILKSASSLNDIDNSRFSKNTNEAMLVAISVANND
ncbi:MULTISPECIES: hypothetical protein [unclassified Providencia]|uniref:hypothetical protein n=1 Tax=unclassified Providencia TaxID=2633465 RepID=UPI00234988F9|nr:hypothetical protein [Providencia sp. PROV239]